MIKFIREMVKVVVDQALMPTGKNLVPAHFKVARLSTGSNSAGRCTNT